MTETMKDSGQEWIGTIPESWDIKRIAALYSPRNTKVSDEDYPPLSVTMQGVLPQLENVAKTDDHSNRKLVKKGDFAINSRSDRRGSCGISQYDGSVSLINTVLKPTGKMNPAYYNWLFHTTLFADEFYKWGHGIVDDLWSTNWQDMKSICVTVPPLDEQVKIADFLDKKCAEIDKLSEDIQKQIDILEEYKKSVITRAVTKGLDPKAEMKDSNIWWVDVTPSHWNITRIKYHYEIISGSGFPIEMQGREIGELPVVKAGDISNQGEKLAASSNYIDRREAAGKFTIVPKNSILMAKIGEAMRKNNRTLSEVDCVLDNNCQGVVPLDVEPRFSFYLMKCVDMKWYDNAGTIPCVNNSKFKNSKIVIPNREEQAKIATFLDEKCKAIDESILTKQSQLDKLSNYKKSIIYEYVTGKKRVA